MHVLLIVPSKFAKMIRPCERSVESQKKKIQKRKGKVAYSLILFHTCIIRVAHRIHVFMELDT